ncbi:MAG: hypothetical protein PVH48_09510 [Cyclobacteriaceae bacterium]|jgi:hypothetical protein
MSTLNILIADFLPQFLNFVIILALLRFYLITGILLVLFLLKRVWHDSKSIASASGDRISTQNTTEINFNKLLTGFPKPFSLNEV